MNLEVAFAAEWERCVRERRSLMGLEAIRRLSLYCIERRKTRAPLWTEDWISPLDAQVGAAWLLDHERRSEYLIVDDFEGSVATGIGYYLNEFDESAPFSVVVNSPSQRSIAELSKMQNCVGVIPSSKLESFLKNTDVAGIAGRFHTVFHALGTFKQVVNEVAKDRPTTCLAIHEAWAGYRYPFQYYSNGNVPNLLHVIELLVTLGALKPMGHSSAIANELSENLKEMNLNSQNTSFIMAGYESTFDKPS